MTIEEAIIELKKFPPHFELGVTKVDHSGEDHDLVADVVAVRFEPHEKIVRLELDGDLENAY